MKGKFKFHFKNGSTLVDRNGYKTLAGAKTWAKAHNMARGGSKVIRITKLKRRATK